MVIYLKRTKNGSEEFTTADCGEAAAALTAQGWQITNEGDYLDWLNKLANTA